MISRLKAMSGVGWLVVGIILALVFLPTAALASGTLAFTGIESANGNKAGVASTGQLLTVEANPNSLFQSGDEPVPTDDSFHRIAAPPSGSALIVTSIHINTYADPSPGSGFVETMVMAGPTCGTEVSLYDHYVSPPTVGDTEVSLAPGLAVPAGDVLCAAAGSISVEADVSGYTVRAADVKAEPVHLAPAVVEAP